MKEPVPAGKQSKPNGKLFFVNYLRNSLNRHETTKNQ